MIELENAIEIGLTLMEAQSLIEEDEKSAQTYAKLNDAIDQAQTAVHVGREKVAYVVIKITG